MSLLLLSFFAGAASSFFGIGGGIFLAALLPVISDFSAKSAIVLALFFSLFLSALNSLIFAVRRPSVSFAPALFLVCTAAPAAYFSSLWARSFSNFTLRLILLSFLLILALLPFFKKFLSSFPVWTAGGGLFMGLAAGLCGFSGGAFLSPVLHEVKALPLSRKAPTTAAVTFCMSLPALLGWDFGGVFFRQDAVLLQLGAFALPGLALGHYLQKTASLRLRVLLLRVLIYGLFLQTLWEIAVRL